MQRKFYRNNSPTFFCSYFRRFWQNISSEIKISKSKSHFRWCKRRKSKSKFNNICASKCVLIFDGSHCKLDQCCREYSVLFFISMLVNLCMTWNDGQFSCGWVNGTGLFFFSGKIIYSRKYAIAWRHKMNMTSKAIKIDKKDCFSFVLCSLWSRQ